MMQSFLISLDPSLTDGERRMGLLATRWPQEHASLLQSSPLWQDTLAHVSPDWAALCAVAIGWLDQTPVSLVSASRDLSTNGTVAAYGAIGKELDGLLKEVSDQAPTPGFLSRLNPKSASSKDPPLARLEALMAQKKALDQSSKDHLRTLRDALDLGQQARELAALVSDALPTLKKEVARRESVVDIESSTSLLEAQKRAQEVKNLTRASSALDLVANRLEQEFSMSSSQPQTELDHMVEQEEVMHTRLDALSNKVGRLIANHGIKHTSNDHKKQIAEVAPPSNNLVVSTPSASTLTERVFSLFVSSKPKKDQFLSENARSVLKSMHGEYSNFGTLLWPEARKLTNDDTVHAMTRIPKSREPVISKLLKTKDHRLYVQDLICIQALLRRTPEDEKSYIEWTLVERMAMQYALEGEGSRQAFELLVDVLKHTKLESPPVDIIEAVKRALRGSSGQEKAPGAHLNIAHVLAKCVEPANLEGGVKTFGRDYLDLVFLTPHLPHSHASKIHKNMLLDEVGSSHTPQPSHAAQMEKLLVNDRVEFAYALVKWKYEIKFKWIETLLNTPAALTDLNSTRSQDTQWAHVLSEYLKMRNPGYGKQQSVPSSLLSHAIETSNLALLDDIAMHHPTRALDKSSRGNDQALLQIMQLQIKRDPETKKVPAPSYWCALLKDQINHPAPLVLTASSQISRRLNDAMEKNELTFALDDLSPTITGTPLMHACQVNALEWIKALIDTGADTSWSKKGNTAMSIWQEKIAHDALKSTNDDAQSICLASEKAQSLFIRTLVRSMDHCGFWDIQAAPPVFKVPVLLEAIACDTNSTLKSDPKVRQSAILKTMSSMTQDEFMGMLAFIPPQNEASGGIQQKALYYGMQCGLLAADPEAVQHVKNEVVARQRARLAIVSEKSTHPRRRI